MHQKKKIEFSKLVFWLVWSTNLAVLIFCGVLIVVNFRRNGYLDSTPFVYMVPSVAAELASATGFYYWKTRTNNVYEYGEKFIVDLVNNGNIDTPYVASIAQAFFQSSQFYSK